AALPSVFAQLEGWSPATIPDETGWKGAKGFGWYRAYVKVPADWAGSRLLLMVDSISNVDEAFVNGEKVGANGSMPPLFGNPSSSIRRPFVLEPDQVRFGQYNLIAWRVYNNNGKGGILKGPVHLSRLDDALDLGGTWLFRRGDVPAWADWQGDSRDAEAEAFLKMAGEKAAGHRGVIPADLEGRRRMLAAVEKHFQGNKNPYARADDKGDPTPAAEAVTGFKTGTGLAVDLVLAEPLVRQPLFIDFDERGRMWVVQYIQYPNPAGLKVLTWDKHLRKVFDQVPPPPPFVKPEHRKFIGKDKITIHEDTDGDGVYDKHKTFAEGLNMVTSLAHGKDGVWVLHPPYLLFYPDKNRDDVPDSDPVIHLSGFNLEDTHSISNSLKFGPDGWLYGCTGSTVTARVRVHLDEKAPRYPFLGQNIWRYHPTLHEFELFAEGGWNNFGVDFDAKGRLYSGTNGNLQAVHFVQGGYYQKGFGKHGPHTNPYAFGHFYGMPIEGEKIRLVHQWIRYESGAIPSLEGRWVGGNSLGNRVHALRAQPTGSTFRTVEQEKPLQSADKWFRPVHCTIGPDGAIYLADFYDARITHVDPRDNWDRSNGRIYRLRARDAKPGKPRNLRKLSPTDLIKILGNRNQWARRHAQRLLAELRDLSVLPALGENLAQDTDAQLALESLWALHRLGAIPDWAPAGLRHPDPHVRAWAVRLLGDRRDATPTTDVQTRLLAMAMEEAHPEVVSQLAATAQRLYPPSAAAIVGAIATRGEFRDDPFIPQQLWWAMESLVSRSPSRARQLLENPDFWDSPLFRSSILERIGRRFMAQRSDESLATCAFLLESSAGTEHLDPLLRGMEKALEGSTLDPVPPALDETLATLWKTAGPSDEVIRFSLRLKSPRALAAARPLAADPETPRTQRLEFLKALAEIQDLQSEAVFLDLFRNEKEDPEIRLTALSALRRYSGEEIPATVLKLYPQLGDDLRQTAQSLLAGRPAWALRLLQAVDQRRIPRESITLDSLLLMRSYQHQETSSLITRHWGELRQSSQAKARRIGEIKALLSGEKKGDPGRGREVFAGTCAACHKFGDQGREIGPNLTGYEMDNLDYLIPAIVDPNLGIREGFELATLTLRANSDSPPAVLTGFLTD
ncbi:MAG: c-type cytochrome, partial [Akkermansiaceae bacterium]|nr:c-type cytochrome [Akkermansiaceae bacterium]